MPVSFWWLIFHEKMIKGVMRRSHGESWLCGLSTSWVTISSEHEEKLTHFHRWMVQHYSISSQISSCMMVIQPRKPEPWPQHPQSTGHHCLLQVHRVLLASAMIPHSTNHWVWEAPLHCSPMHKNNHIPEGWPAPCHGIMHGNRHAVMSW